MLRASSMHFQNSRYIAFVVDFRYLGLAQIRMTKLLLAVTVLVVVACSEAFTAKVAVASAIGRSQLRPLSTVQRHISAPRVAACSPRAFAGLSMQSDGVAIVASDCKCVIGFISLAACSDMQVVLHIARLACNIIYFN